MQKAQKGHNGNLINFQFLTFLQIDGGSKIIYHSVNLASLNSFGYHLMLFLRPGVLQLRILEKNMVSKDLTLDLVVKVEIVKEATLVFDEETYHHYSSTIPHAFEANFQLFHARSS